MKKLLLIAGIVFLLVSCGEKEYNVSIANDSNKIVSYVYNNIKDTLSISQAKTYKVPSYTQPPYNIVDENKIASISLKPDNITGNYSFVDAEFYNLIIKNYSTHDIVVKAEILIQGHTIEDYVINYIDNGGLPSISISSGVTHTGSIVYSENPPFKFNFPVKYNNIKDNNDITVTIFD